ncbi:MAG: hypothetical protein K9L68_09855, partial [Spirochaetales bacterium]|nr:hypothetical protein [Spirochaetales bacterium]
MKILIRSILSLCLLAGVGVVLSAQYKAPPGWSQYEDMIRPGTLAAAPSVVASGSSLDTLINPAAAGSFQRAHLGLNYFALNGFGSDSGYAGHSVAAGVSIPTRIGVFSGNGRFFNESFDSLSMGTVTSLSGAFSKKIYPDLLFGAGLVGTLAMEERTDWGLALDTGFMHMPGDLGIFPDFRWGFALRGLGKPAVANQNYSAVPAPVTPALGAAFTPVRNESFVMDLHFDISAPFIQSVKLSAGTQMNIADSFGVQAGLSLDLIEALEGNGRELPFAAGLFFTWKTDIKRDVEFLDITRRGWNRSDVQLHAAAAPLKNDIWAIGGGAEVALGVIDTDPPKLAVEYETPRWISPNFDGIQDSLEVPIDITDERPIAGYRMTITNDSGEVIREIENKEMRPENISLQSFYERLVAVEEGIPVPDSIVWNGRNRHGSIVPDGAYLFQLDAWDDNGNIRESRSYQVHIDASPPQAEVTVGNPDDLVFSPNGDGRKDTLEIIQSGSPEQEWTGMILNSKEEPVRIIEWKKQEPENFVWDGKNDEGTLVEDGVYAYQLASTDAAGNSVRENLTNIILETGETPAQVYIDNAEISPNGDGIRDTTTFRLELPVREGIVFWEFIVRYEDGTDMYSLDGNEDPPRRVILPDPETGEAFIQEGMYTGILEVHYTHGNNPKAVSPPLHVDTTPPAAELSAEFNVFSPNGDGRKDQIVFQQKTEEAKNWEGVISRQNGPVVKSFEWTRTPPEQISWNGITEDGEQAKDGSYEYMLTGTDYAGNTKVANPIEFTLDTGETAIFLNTSRDAFSPNNDGSADRVALLPRLRPNEGIESYKLIYRNEDGDNILEINGNGPVPEKISWDGRDTEGSPVPDGRYKAELSVVYEKGDARRAETGEILVDTRPPGVLVETDYLLFSPDGDGNRDILPIRNDARPPEEPNSSVKIWQAQIIDEQGDSVANFRWDEGISPVEWDGRDDSGNLLPDGSYRYRLTGTDAAGNTTEKMIEQIRIDTRKTPLYITSDRKAFSPNGDGRFDSIAFSVVTGLNEGIDSWHFTIETPEGNALLSRKGGSPAPPTGFVWDGKDLEGKTYEGLFYAKLRIFYEKGNRPLDQVGPMRSDISPPNVQISANPKPFSPDNDGMDDELKISTAIRDDSPLGEWSLEIIDPTGTPFQSFTGKGRPAESFVWDGRSSTGELVQSAEDYPYTFTIEDTLGNKTIDSGSIPVDILVIREGDKLKIQISSIQFAPYSPRLDTGDPEKVEKNQKILDRLAQILGRYSSYRIM